MLKAECQPDWGTRGPLCTVPVRKWMKREVSRGDIWLACQPSASSASCTCCPRPPPRGLTAPSPLPSAVVSPTLCVHSCCRASHGGYGGGGPSSARPCLGGGSRPLGKACEGVSAALTPLAPLSQVSLLTFPSIVLPGPRVGRPWGPGQWLGAGAAAGTARPPSPATQWLSLDQPLGLT